MKLYMPAIRNAILLILSRKSAEDLLTAEGKVQLAGEIQRGAARAMGYEIEEPEPETAVDAVGRRRGTKSLHLRPRSARKRRWSPTTPSCKCTTRTSSSSERSSSTLITSPASHRP